MRAKIMIGFSALACVWLLAAVVRAQQPTSRVIPFQGVATTIPPNTPGQALTIQLWDAAVTPPGNLVFSEAQTLDVDANGAISFVFGSQTVNGLDPANFSSGSSRFLDVVDSTNTSVLPSPPGRIPLNAVAFALSPGPTGPAGPQGPPGPPGVVQAVSPGDASIFVGGTAANPTVAVAANGITNANVANGALTPAKIAGIAATLGPNLFTGSQGINGDLNLTGNLTLVDSTATAGNILKRGLRFIHNFGINNVFVGQNAGNLTMTGQANTGSGANALMNNTTGGQNTATGFSALHSNTTGVGNTASGWIALTGNTTGQDNTASGAFALLNNTTGSDNTASGVQALLNNNGDSNTATGLGALQGNTTGGNNTAVGVTALFSNTIGGSNTAIGSGADVSMGNLTNATAIGAGAVVNASNKIRLGNASVTVVEGQVAYTFPSDRNQKENFQPVDGEQVLRRIGGLSLTSWNYMGHDPKQFRHYGPVAQEFFAAFGHDGMGTIGTPTTINSGDMEGILMIAIQALEKRTEEQSKQLDALRAENADLKGRLKETVEALKAENAALKERLGKLERAVGSRVLATKAQ
jgi:hypothetical protein